jgi:hypothetical protein
VGCEHGVCGACTVRMDGRIMRGCLTLAAQADGAEVWTIEGVSETGEIRDLQDRSVPLEKRLMRYYEDYASTNFNHDWMRIFLFSGLKGEPINRRYLQIVRERILRVICAELRNHFGLPEPAATPIDADEVDIAWSLHAAIFYIGVRKLAYQEPVPDDLSPYIRRNVRTFLRGVEPELRELMR